MLLAQITVFEVSRDSGRTQFGDNGGYKPVNPDNVVEFFAECQRNYGEYTGVFSCTYDGSFIGRGWVFEGKHYYPDGKRRTHICYVEFIQASTTEWDLFQNITSESFMNPQTKERKGI